MELKDKLAFVHRMTKMGLQHFDTGGGVVGGNQPYANPGGLPTNVQSPTGGGWQSDVSGFTPTGMLNGLSNSLTTQNTFNAQSPTSAGTVGAEQGTLYGELANEAAGNGPNPAQSQYLQNAGQIAQQGAQTYAQNRALNPAEAARLSGNQAAGLENQAASTAAIQQADQQLGAQGQLGQLTGQEQQGALSAQAINAQISQNNANAINSTQGGILGGVGSALTAGIGSFAGGGSVLSPYAPNFSNAGNGTGFAVKDNSKDKSSDDSDDDDDSDPFSTMTAQSEIDNPASSTGGGLLGGGAGDVGGISAGDAALAAKGGIAKMPNRMALGGPLMELAPLIALAAKGGLAKHLDKMHPHVKQIALIMHPEHCYDGGYPPTSGYNQGGVSPYAGKENKFVTNFARGGGNVKAKDKAEKAVKKGDNYANDKIPALLSEGELVVDRDTMNDPGPAGKMARALAMHIKAKKKGKKS